VLNFLKVDLHLHSEFSWDSKVKIEDYIKKAEDLDYGAISITDHNSVESHQVIDRLQKSTNILLVPGQEVSTMDGHLLVYGWLDLLPRDLSMKETTDIVKKQHGWSIAAHPFDIFRKGSLNKIYSTQIDGLEILNASTWIGFFNFLAKQSSKRHPDLLTLGNSDSHRIEEFGSVWMNVTQFTTVEQLFNGMKNSIIHGSRIGIFKKISRLYLRKFKS